MFIALLGTPPTFAGDNAPEQWDRTGAIQYLDERGENWFNFGGSRRGEGSSAVSCVSCHTLLPYIFARPALRKLSNENAPTKLEAKVLEQAKLRVTNWDRLDEPPFQLFYDFDDDKKKQSRGTEAIFNALVLSLDDRLQGRQEPSADTRKALSILWATQIAEGKYKGSWEWINFGLEPWEAENSRFLGASLAAIAVSAVPENVRASTEGGSQERLDSLRQYLKSNSSSQNLHNRLWMLWASTSMDQLLAPQEKDQLIEQILAKQQDGGGWSLPALGVTVRKEVTAPVAASDGYSTGLALHVLQLAGVPKDHVQISKGLAWLRLNQSPASGWRALSVNKNRAPESKDAAKANVGKFMWDAATGYAVLALSH
jgi:squalene-hopene/tetraprenyl-beta-curcumene cyclase